MFQFKTLPTLVTMAVSGTAVAAPAKYQTQIQQSGVKYRKKAQAMVKKQQKAFSFVFVLLCYYITQRIMRRHGYAAKLE